MTITAIFEETRFQFLHLVFQLRDRCERSLQSFDFLTFIHTLTVLQFTNFIILSIFRCITLMPYQMSYSGNLQKIPKYILHPNLLHFPTFHSTTNEMASFNYPMTVCFSPIASDLPPIATCLV